VRDRWRTAPAAVDVLRNLGYHDLDATSL
jgi:hypothetical protein